MFWMQLPWYHTWMSGWNWNAWVGRYVVRDYCHWPEGRGSGCLRYSRLFPHAVWWVTNRVPCIAQWELIAQKLQKKIKIVAGRKGALRYVITLTDHCAGVCFVRLKTASAWSFFFQLWTDIYVHVMKVWYLHSYYEQEQMTFCMIDVSFSALTIWHFSTFLLWGNGCDCSI